MAYNLFPAKSFPYPICPYHVRISCFIISYMLIPCPICLYILRLPLYRSPFFVIIIRRIFFLFLVTKGINECS